MAESLENLNIELAHIGINPVNNRGDSNLCQLFSRMTGKKIRDNGSSYFVGNALEIMKYPWKGTHGHIGFWTDDIVLTMKLFNENGFSVDMGTIQYSDTGSIKVVYLKEEYGGFAIHLMQR